LQAAERTFDFDLADERGRTGNTRPETVADGRNRLRGLRSLFVIVTVWERWAFGLGQSDSWNVKARERKPRTKLAQPLSTD